MRVIVRLPRLPQAMLALAMLVGCGEAGSREGKSMTVLVGADAGLFFNDQLVVRADGAIVFVAASLVVKGRAGLYAVQPDGGLQRLTDVARRGFCVEPETGAILARTPAAAGGEAVAVFDGASLARLETPAAAAEARHAACLPRKFRSAVRNGGVDESFIEGPRQIDGRLWNLRAVERDGARFFRFHAPDAAAPAEVLFDWSLRERGSLQTGPHNWRQAPAGVGEPLTLYPNIAQFERAAVWRDGEALPMPSFGRDGSFMVRAVPWSPLFAQRPYAFALSRVGRIAALGPVSPDAEDDQAGLWIETPQGAWRQVKTAPVVARTLALGPDGCRAGIVSEPLGDVGKPQALLTVDLCARP